jgi:hypothetical protein
MMMVQDARCASVAALNTQRSAAQQQQQQLSRADHVMALGLQ